MGLSKVEKNKLKIFNNLALDRNQIDTLLGRTITDEEWDKINRDYQRVFIPITKVNLSNMTVMKWRLFRLCK